MHSQMIKVTRYFHGSFPNDLISSRNQCRFHEIVSPIPNSHCSIPNCSDWSKDCFDRRNCNIFRKLVWIGRFVKSQNSELVKSGKRKNLAKTKFATLFFKNCRIFIKNSIPICFIWQHQQFTGTF